MAAESMQSSDPVDPAGWVGRALTPGFPPAPVSPRAERNASSFPVRNGPPASLLCKREAGGDFFPAECREALLLQAIQQGLPLVPRPYAELGRQTGLSEAEVIARLEHWTETGLIKRLGVVVRHRSLGYRANAMVVWDIPDERVADIGRRMSAFAFVTLCYRRPRRGGDWPYNLFCMIHGKDRAKVEAQVEGLALALGLADAPRAVLFSRRCFKQRGARYAQTGNVPV